MTLQEIDSYVGTIENAIIRRFGANWRQFLTWDLQWGIISSEILNFVLGNQWTLEDIRNLTRACHRDLAPA